VLSLKRLFHSRGSGQYSPIERDEGLLSGLNLNEQLNHLTKINIDDQIKDKMKEIKIKDEKNEKSRFV